MITEISPQDTTATFEWTRSRAISVEVAAPCVLRNILYDKGDGPRPFQPLAGTIAGVPIALPMALAAGSHSFLLTGEPFDGVGLTLIGWDMQNVTRISVDESPSAATPVVSHTEYAGVPANTVGTNGCTHWDTRTVEAGGQILYRKTAGSWRAI